MSRPLVVQVYRYDPNLDEPACYQTYTVPYFENMDVIDALRYIQNHLDPSLAFRFSCEEGKCGLCGVLVNGKPALACKHVLAAGGMARVDPLPGFPVVKDLVVDRAAYYKEQRSLQQTVEDRSAYVDRPDRDRFQDFAAFKDCVECSLCSAGCPAAPALTHPHMGPPGFSQVARAALFDGGVSDAGASELFRCFLCGYCESICPREVPIRTLNRRARHVVKGQWPPVVSTLLSRLKDKRVLVGSGSNGTAAWLRDNHNLTRTRVQHKAPIGIFVGCQFGMRQSRSHTPINLTRLLDVARVQYTLLGSEEWCCGHPNYLAGEIEEAREFATHNIEAFRKLGVTDIVTGCPGCYTAWKTEYAETLQEQIPFKVWHTSEFLWQLLEEGRIALKGPSTEAAVYHDPCELGRLNNIYDAPRFILGKAVNNVIELEHSRETSHCCGGGGLTLGAHPDVARQAAVRRVEEILECGLSVIVTACPSCETVLESTLQSLGKNILVHDIVDVLYGTMIGDIDRHARSGKA